MLNEDLDRHISLHHALGFKFRTQSLLLRNFVAYAEAHGRSGHQRGPYPRLGGGSAIA